MTAVTVSTIYSSSLAVLKSLIQDNVTDPRNRPDSNWIWTTEPDVKSNKFKGYPIIVVSPAEVNDDAITLDRGFRDTIFDFIIEIRDVYDKTDKNGNLVLDTISDSLLNVLRRGAGTTTLGDNNLFNQKIQSSSYSSIDESQQKLNVRAFAVQLNNQFDV